LIPKRLLVAFLAAALLIALAGPVGTPLTSAPAEAGIIASRTDKAAAVERLYRAYFGRVPERAGIVFWTGRADDGMSLDQISQVFAEGPEFIATYGVLNDAQFVRLVYRNVLGRAPDAAGLAHWTNQLQTGQQNRGRAMLGFSDSPEFRIAVGHLDPGEVERLYRAFFLRPPDASGRAYWLQQRASGTPLASIAANFAASQEFTDRYGSLDNPGFVSLVYQNVLGRQPDAAGLDFWVGQLRTGRANRGEVMIGFSESPEFGAPVVHPDRDLGRCRLFPADSFWQQRVDNLAVHPASDQYVSVAGANKTALPNFGAGLWRGQIIGIPWIAVDASEIPDVRVNFQYDSESDPGPYPVRWDSPIEGNSDRHVLVVDRETCTLTELFRVVWQPDGSIEAGSGARYNLNSNDLRPETWTSADAAGLAILPGLVRYEEVATGSIKHAIRFTIDGVGPGYVWPARHEVGPAFTNQLGPPFGTRFRLKASVDLNQFTGQARVIVQAMRDYGLILADRGASWSFSGAPDDRWDNQNLRQLRTLTGSDFEAVDTSGLIVSSDSGASSGTLS